MRDITTFPYGMNTRVIFILVENKSNDLSIIISFNCVCDITRFLPTCFFDNINVMIIENLSQFIVVCYNLVVMEISSPTKEISSPTKPQPGSKGQLPTSVLTLVPVRSNSLFDWLFDNKRLTNYSKELLLGFGEKLVNFGSLSWENRTKD